MIQKKNNDEFIEIINSYNEYTAKVSTGVVEIARVLREDNTTLALEMIKDFSEGVVWLIQVGAILKENDYYVDTDFMKMNEFLEEINEGLQLQDFVLVADIFEYEVAPFFESIDKVNTLM